MIATCTKPPPTNVFTKALIRAAGLAPSPDNNQPWTFRACDESIEVFHCRSRAVPSDVDDLFAGIAMGAAIENMSLEASCRGFLASVKYADEPFARGGEHEPVATVRWTSSGRRDQLAEFVAARTTNRRPYETATLTNPELSELSSAIQNSKCSLAWRTTNDELRRLSRMVTVADRIRFEHRSFHDELHTRLRFGPAAAMATADGLELASLEIPRIAWPLLRWLRPWPRMKRLNHLGLSRLFARNSIVQIRRSGAVGLLTVDRPDRFGFLESGRALQRVWLAATRLGLAFQPVGALPLFLRRLTVLGENAFDPKHATMLLRARDEFAEQFPESRERIPVILFRVGRCGPPSARSYRYPVDRIKLD